MIPRFDPNARIDSRKTRRIMGAAVKLGIFKSGESREESKLYDMIEAQEGVRSISALTNAQADRIIKELERQIGTHKVKKPRTPEKYDSIGKKADVRSLITPDQMSLVDELIGRINAKGHDLDREKRAQHQFKTEFRKLTRHQAQGMIEGLKAIERRIG